MTKAIQIGDYVEESIDYMNSTWFGLVISIRKDGRKNVYTIKTSNAEIIEKYRDEIRKSRNKISFNTKLSEERGY